MKRLQRQSQDRIVHSPRHNNRSDSAVAPAMDKSLQEDQGSPQQSDQVKKAQELANDITLNRFTSKLKATPAADLTQLLEQQATAYPRLRDSLTQAAKRRTASCDAPDHVNSPAEDSQQSPAESRGLLFKRDVKVAHPLSQKLLLLAGVIEPKPGGRTHQDIDSSTVQALSQAMKSGQILYNLHGTFLLSVGESVVVKIAPSLDLDGITNLQYINTHVSEVPAPLCLGSLTSGQKTYFFMSRAEGTPLEAIWPRISVALKLSVQEQLNNIFRALRTQSLGPDENEGAIGSFTSGICKDMRRSERVREGIIHDEAAFNDFLCFDPSRSTTPWIRMIRSFMTEDHRVVRTHGDLHPRNIMVKWETDEESESVEGEGNLIRVTSLIDWEAGGWYPEYWEFVKALSTIDLRGPLADWCDYLPTEAIGIWPLEFSIDSLIGRWLG